MSSPLARFASCLCLLTLSGPSGHADETDPFIRSTLRQHCVRCHGGDEVNADINLLELVNADRLHDQPALLENIIDAVDGLNMPPEDEQALGHTVRERLVSSLKRLLRSADDGDLSVRIRRLNRLQYNNTVRDLFQLRKDVFALPEKLMTRHDNYLNRHPAQMPERVDVVSRALRPEPGLEGVKPFPKDLRAAHGFDNQANQLTLSPLLLDAFLRLSVSIVESPDFNEQNVGIWDSFFRPPSLEENATELSNDEYAAAIKTRLKSFLRLAFRSRVQPETLDRYTSYALSKIEQGESFTDSMKKVASAVLSSPLFLYRSASTAPDDRPFLVASRLSYFLWGSGPDLQLLDLAEKDRLSDRDVLVQQIDRMIADPKIERFLDTVPAQWMQLENVLAATPDPQKNRFFSLDKERPASLQMVLEPLLLFDAVFLEDRPISELIAPTFAYRSDFLKTWYETDLTPPAIDRGAIELENRRRDEKRQTLQTAIRSHQMQLDRLVTPVRKRLLAAKQNGPEPEPVDLHPYAAWFFDGDMKDAIGSLHLNAHGDIRFENDAVVLEKAYLLSEKLPIDLRAKTLEVWCKPHNLDQRGGGVIGIQGPGDFFDTIVLGERKPRHWISGSNGFSRTKDFPESKPETEADSFLHLVMVYAEDGTVTLYRNGTPYGLPFRTELATFPKNETSVIFGLRHLPAGGNRYLPVTIDRATLYDRALTPAEVAESTRGNGLYVTEAELVEALTEQQRAERTMLLERLRLSKLAVEAVPANRDVNQVQQESDQRFDEKIRGLMRAQTFKRTPASDPRYGGVITSAAMLSMTSGPKRTHPIARGAWVIEVIFNDPPPPPPNDVPPLNEEQSAEHLTIREKFAQHRENPDCAGCHSRLDPLGFALENFDITGRWRDRYENGRDVDASGVLMRRHPFESITEFKSSLIKEKRRFAKAFTKHLLRFALSRELYPRDSLTVDAIIDKTEPDDFKLRSLIRQVILSERFQITNGS